MRRYSFLIGAVSAVVTFVALSAFTGIRPWNRENRRASFRHRDHCDFKDRFSRDRAADSTKTPVGRFRQTTPIDSASPEILKPDSTQNR